jgi:hypothetical protein
MAICAQINFLLLLIKAGSCGLLGVHIFVVNSFDNRHVLGCKGE